MANTTDWSVPVRAFGGMGLFALLADPFGIILAAAAGLLLAIGISQVRSPLAGAVVVGVVTSLAWLTFVQLLGRDLPLRPAF